jgi:hypothetical protein
LPPSASRSFAAGKAVGAAIDRARKEEVAGIPAFTRYRS